MRRVALLSVVAANGKFLRGMARLLVSSSRSLGRSRLADMPLLRASRGVERLLFLSLSALRPFRVRLDLSSAYRRSARLAFGHNAVACGRHDFFASSISCSALRCESAAARNEDAQFAGIDRARAIGIIVWGDEQAAGE